MMISLITRAELIAVIMLCGAILQAPDAATAQTYRYSPDDPVDALILAAGNAATDEQRLDYLRQLRMRLDLPAQLKADLDKLVPSIDRWTYNEVLWYYHNPGDFQYQIDESSPLYPIFVFYKARGLVWRQMESGKIWSQWADQHDAYLADVWHMFQITRQAFPDNPIARMYLGEPLPSPLVIEPDPKAPAWAAATREAIVRCNDLYEWWVDHRLTEQGVFRGGEDDDCEMWREWAGILIGFDNPKLTEAQAFFTRSLLAQEFLQQGYSDRDLDVEHTSEPTSDTLTCMLHLEPDDPQWTQRTLRILDMMEKTWMGVNQRGFLQFKSMYINADRVNPDPAKACDVPYCFSAATPVMLYWQRSGDPRCTKLFSAWLDTWVDASNRTDGGKPAGVIPASIQWPDGLTCNPSTSWWDPQCHPMENTLYEWPMALGNVTQALVLGYHMTGNEKYIEPLRALIHLRMQFLDNPDMAKDATPGSAAWVASRRIGGSCAGAAVRYRMLSGSREFDDYLLREGGSYIQYRLQPDEKNFDKVTAHIADTADVLRYNVECHTSEARYTDRFFSDRFNKMLPPDSPMFGRSVDALLLYNLVTGDPAGNPKVLPLNAVRWMTEPKDLGVFVTNTGSDRFESLLYNFQNQDRDIDAEFYLLKSGDYLVKVIADGTVLHEYDLPVSKRITRMTFTLPPRISCRLEIKPAGSGLRNP